MTPTPAQPRIVIPCSDGKIGIDAPAPWAFRVRFARGDTFAEGALNRYGVVRPPNPPPESAPRIRANEPKR